MSLELWREIEGFPNYKVSSWGRVYSIRAKKIMHPEVHSKGYLRVDLYDGQGRKHARVHRLVAEAFIPKEAGKTHINHIDGNNQNNSITNLEWVTNAENARKAQELRAMKEWTMTERSM